MTGPARTLTFRFLELTAAIARLTSRFLEVTDRTTDNADRATDSPDHATDTPDEAADNVDRPLARGAGDAGKPRSCPVHGRSPRFHTLNVTLRQRRLAFTHGDCLNLIWLTPEMKLRSFGVHPGFISFIPLFDRTRDPSALLFPSEMEYQAGVESIESGAVVPIEPLVMPEEQAKVTCDPHGEMSADKHVYTEARLHGEVK
jgi:hypothetical protein